MGDALKAWFETLNPRNPSSANWIGPSADPTAYWTLAVFPEGFAPGTFPPTHKSVLMIEYGTRSMGAQGTRHSKLVFTFLQPDEDKVSNDGM